MDEKRQIALAFAQRRQPDRVDVEPIIQVAAELAGGDHGLQIAVGGGDDPDVAAN